MTYCEEIGLNIGDKIRVLRTSPSPYYKAGDVLTLVRDDGSEQPWFRRGDFYEVCFGLTGVNVGGKEVEGVGWVRLDENGEVKLPNYPPIGAPAHDPINKPIEDSPLQRQEGGDHYKKQAIQPVEYIMANGIPYMEGNVIKYVSRWRDKGGVQDLKKAIHYLEMLIEHEEKQG